MRVEDGMSDEARMKALDLYENHGVTVEAIAERFGRDTMTTYQIIRVARNARNKRRKAAPDYAKAFASFR